MLDHPDIVPSVSINHWIVRIKTFYFDLVHVPSKRHGPDGLSRRPPQPGDAVEPEDDFNAAWEVLDLARAIYEKQQDESDEMRLKLADVFITLGDVSLETGVSRPCSYLVNSQL